MEPPCREAGPFLSRMLPVCVSIRRSGHSAPGTISASGAFVEGNDAGAAEAEIVLQGEPRALDLPGLRRAAQLVCQLVALRETGGAERMALGQQTAGGIGHG